MPSLLDAIRVAAALGVGTEEPDDEMSREYTRAVIELLQRLYMPGVREADARMALFHIFQAIGREN